MEKEKHHLMYFDPGTVAISYCLVEINDLKIIDWALFSIKDSKKGAKIKKTAKDSKAADNENTEVICTNLANKLKTLDLTKYSNIIIGIEIQPKINVITNIIYGQLYMYYVLSKMINPNIKKIIGYHAGNKIKYYKPLEGDEPMPDRIDKLKKGHYKNKQTLIEHCKRILIHNDEKEWNVYFNSLSKRDDISDTYISSLSMIQTHNLRKI